MKRYSELVKNLAITLLAVSALFLVGLSIFSQSELQTETLYVRAEAPSLRWLGVSGVTSYDGTERLGAVYLPEGRDACLSALSESLSRAMNTADSPVPAEESEWRLALASRCIYITFYEALPAEVLWDAFSADGAPALLASALILTPDGDSGTAKLLFKNEEGQFLRTVTALPADAIGTLSSGISVPVRLAAELGDPYTAQLPSDTLLSDETGLPAYTLERTISFGAKDFNLLSQLLTAFSVDPYTDSGYTDASGRRVYKSAAGTLSLSPDGTVHFSAGQSDAGIPCTDSGKSELLTALSSAVELLQNAAGSEENFQYSLRRVTEDDGYTFLFGATAGGVPLMVDDTLITGQVIVREGRITEAEFLHFSSAESIGYSEGVLTGRQAYAAFCSAPAKDRTLHLVYSLDASVATPRWITVKKEDSHS